MADDAKPGGAIGVPPTVDGRGKPAAQESAEAPLGTMQLPRGAVMPDAGAPAIPGAPAPLMATMVPSTAAPLPTVAPPAMPQIDPLNVKYQSGTWIFALGSNVELTTAALQSGTRGQVDGVLADPAVGPLKSALIVLDQDTTPEFSLLDATVKSIVPLAAGADPALREFAVDTASLTNKCVKTDADTVDLLITESQTSVTVVETNLAVDFSVIAVSDVVDIYGSEEAGCVLADSIQEYKTAP